MTPLPLRLTPGCFLASARSCDLVICLRSSSIGAACLTSASTVSSTASSVSFAAALAASCSFTDCSKAIEAACLSGRALTPARNARRPIMTPSTAVPMPAPSKAALSRPTSSSSSSSAARNSVTGFCNSGTIWIMLDSRCSCPSKTVKSATAPAVAYLPASMPRASSNAGTLRLAACRDRTALLPASTALPILPTFPKREAMPRPGINPVPN